MRNAVSGRRISNVMTNFFKEIQMGKIMKSTKLKLMLVALSATVLVACGGGGGGGGGGAGDAPLTPGWQSAQLLELSNAPAEGADVAINASGVGYAVWLQVAEGKQGVFASRYSNGEWGAAQLVSSEALIAGPASHPQVVALPDGEALVLWAQSIPGGTRSVMGKRSTNGGGWTEFNEVELSINLETADDLELVADNNGNAAAVWAQREEGEITGDVHYALFQNGAFNTSQAITDTDAEHGEPDIAIDSEGKVLVVWLERSFVNGVLADRVFVRSVMDILLGDIVNLSGATNLDASEPSVTWGPGGSALVAWSQALPTGAGSQIESKGSDNALDVNAWSPLFVASGQGNFGFLRSDPQVVIDAQDRAVIVWQQEGLGDQRDDVVAVHWNGTAWGLPQTVDSHVAGASPLPQLAADANGQAIAVWRQDAGPRINMASARLNMASGQWSAPELIENDNTGDARNAPSLAMNASGRALAAWEQTAGSPSADSILANVFIK